ncbi:hypothetical protein CLOP_g21818, partial [Closterium sp. NIES-67]
LAKIMRKLAKIFPDELPPGLPPERPHDYKIELEPGAQSTVRSQWRVSQLELLELCTQLDYQLEKKIIRPSTSPYAALILFTPKKDGGLHMCTDYRALNSITIKSRYLIPRADDLIDQLRGARIFSKIDLRGGYHKIRVTESDIQILLFEPLEFLGHVISTEDVKIDLKRNATIRNWEALTNVKELQSFMGFVNYVRRLIPQMAESRAPLTDLLQRGAALDQPFVLVTLLLGPASLRSCSYQQSRRDAPRSSSR